MDNVKVDFIEDELSKWAVVVDQKVRAAVAANKIGVTNAGLRSIAYQVFRSTTGNDGKYQLSFNEYLRMVDMGTGRGGRGKRTETLEGNRKKWEGRKPKKFYSKTAYGSLNNLILNLLNNYQESTAETIKTAMQ